MYITNNIKKNLDVSLFIESRQKWPRRNPAAETGCKASTKNSDTELDFSSGNTRSYLN